MAQTAEATTEVVEAVTFGFMTNEEVIKHSVVEVTNPNLLDALDKPVPGGLYDPAMGPLDDGSRCKSCGQRSYHCNGHFGRIGLFFPAYNPLLFNDLHKLLKKTCLHCCSFKSSNDEVESCVIQLKLVMDGDITTAKNYGEYFAAKKARKQKKKKKEEDISDLVDDEFPEVCTPGPPASAVQSRLEIRDSSQLKAAMSILNEFLKKEDKTCWKCRCKSPKIKKPTFGWFNMEKLKQAEIRSNAIHGNGVDATHSRSEVVNASDSSCSNDSETAEINSSIISSDKFGRRKKKHVSEKEHSDPVVGGGPLLPSEVRDILSSLWKNEAPLCSYIHNIMQQQYKRAGVAAGHIMYFLESILVKPIKFRPQARAGDSVMDHPHTTLLGKVLQSNNALRIAHVKEEGHSKIISRWMELQRSINVFYDSKNTSQGKKDSGQGVCQVLEKKEGIFRMNMMGKRVNYACRSVISPDPYLGVHEIGIPPNFAKKLTYPERVTPWNAEKLRGAVINGPEVHPGAITYGDSVATVKLPLNKKQRIAIARKLPSSRGAVALSEKKNELEFESKVVYRHLEDGDIVLVNRQPTLHKPSIMAHVVRVLPGEKTLRMHYANCSSYNADFDGDEMNVHFPQDEISRAEAYNIVNANEQYIVPTRGDTVRGLIQDHIVGAVLLTMKNTFLTRSEFSHLLYASGIFSVGRAPLQGKQSQKVALVDSEGLVASVLPAIWKPEPLWTGKQVITALLNQITRGCAPCTVENQGKIPKSYFADASTKNGEQDEEHNVEHNLLIWKNELVRGVIDKAQFGKFGLVHTVQELYGSNNAGVLLSALSRLFTIFLQIHGFTCGLDDLIILPDYDVQRKDKLEGEDVGEEVHCEFVKFKPGQIGPEELQLEIQKAVCSDRESATAFLDMKMKNKLTNKLTREGSQILKHLLTAGLLKPFPRNCIAVMTTTGAKGSTVNFQQISAYLGQQELEGKRVPRMVSGKTLPSFPPWDFTSRAGGFITDRFLSGLRPQEYYFHCMAGREGLVDTAVKTSRSGYLQRCLIKNLEGLKVSYDYTVRDAGDSIIQFCYGEDGVDVHRTSFLNNFKALKDNGITFRQKFQNERDFNTYIEKLPVGLEEEARRFIQEAKKKSSETSKRKSSRKDQENFVDLVKQKYLSSLAQAGEPVGVIAAQSVGEPSTQMTLNTFHLAGRGEMNVTLGIPRLQEILMTAPPIIKTPILTCPFSQLRPKNDVVSLVSKVKKVSVADLVESMEVQLSIDRKVVARIYKLKIKLKDTEFVSLENTQETLRSSYLRELEETIRTHIKFLTKISSSSEDSAIKPMQVDDDNGNDDHDNCDDVDDVDDDMGEDLGSDVQKRKEQASDEVDYDDDDASDIGPNVDASDVEPNEDDLPTESARDLNEETEAKTDDDLDNVGEVSNEKSENKNKDANDKSDNYWGKDACIRIRNPSAGFDANKKWWAINLEIRGLHFEVDFKFTDESHILLAQIAQKAAKKVYINKSGKVSQCKMVQYDPDEKTIIWDAKNKTKDNEQEDLSYWAMKASGVDFQSFWELGDDLDLTRLYSNDIQAMLTTYGVEAAKATIVREVKNVFDIYGVKVDFRHLSLIADFMTHTGKYLPMSRHGSISESLSPLLKMSFETAAKFIIEAASHGLTDDLETPSSRICLGLPVKMGTGSFDVMQKLDV